MISVIVPFRDAEKYIARCADSLARQQGDFEFIFVNDHSTDSGSYILSKYDDRFFVIDNQRKAGVSGARNTGLSITRGEWVTFLDADDEYLPDTWVKFNEMLRTQADILQADHVRRYVHKGITINRWPNAAGMYSITHLPQTWFGVWNKLYRRSMIYGLRFNEDLQYGEDELFNLECLARSDRLWCSGLVTVRHNIENMKSLSHIVTEEDLRKQLKALIDYAARQSDPRLRRIATDRIAQYKKTALYSNVI